MAIRDYNQIKCKAIRTADHECPPILDVKIKIIAWMYAALNSHCFGNRKTTPLIELYTPTMHRLAYRLHMNKSRTRQHCREVFGAAVMGVADGDGEGIG